MQAGLTHFKVGQFREWIFFIMSLIKSFLFFFFLINVFKAVHHCGVQSNSVHLKQLNLLLFTEFIYFYLLMYFMN